VLSCGDDPALAVSSNLAKRADLKLKLRRHGRIRSGHPRLG
jgi:hypothetical protein